MSVLWKVSQYSYFYFIKYSYLENNYIRNSFEFLKIMQIFCFFKVKDCYLKIFFI